MAIKLHASFRTYFTWNIFRTYFTWNMRNKFGENAWDRALTGNPFIRIVQALRWKIWWKFQAVNSTFCFDCTAPRMYGTFIILETKITSTSFCLKLPSYANWRKEKTLKCGDDDSVFGDMTSTQALRPVCVWEAVWKSRWRWRRSSCPQTRPTGRSATRQLQRPPRVPAPWARCSSPWWPRRCRWSGRRPPRASLVGAGLDRCKCHGHTDRLSPAYGRSLLKMVKMVYKAYMDKVRKFL